MWQVARLPSPDSPPTTDHDTAWHGMEQHPSLALGIALSLGQWFSSWAAAHGRLPSNPALIACVVASMESSPSGSAFLHQKGLQKASADPCPAAVPQPLAGEKGAVRASSIFPILSVILLFMGGLCIAASEFYKSRHNIILSAGILFVSAGLSNIIGMIVYISANAGDPTKSDSKKNSYSYGWSFYFGALSFIMAEMVGVLAVHMFIDRHRELRAGARAADYLQGSAITRIPSYPYRYRRRSRSSSRSTDPSHSRDASPVGLKGFGALPSTEISMYTLTRGGDTLKGSHGTPTATYNSDRDHNFLQVHNCIQKELKDSSNTANRRTTPV
ncbi:hypothetical protein NFI96_005579 [Prochilodus magdalenae]|nr:hypothetical protein NFI96_005579 [Prochilodus magdalenae]